MLDKRKPEITDIHTNEEPVDIGSMAQEIPIKAIKPTLYPSHKVRVVGTTTDINGEQIVPDIIYTVITIVDDVYGIIGPNNLSFKLKRENLEKV